MPLRFRKRIRLFPGACLNVSKTGISTSIGGDGETVNVGKRNTRTMLGVPGTGLSYVRRSSSAQQVAGDQRRSGPIARGLAIVLWLFLVLYLIRAMG